MSLEIDVLKIDIDALTELVMNREAELLASNTGTKGTISSVKNCGKLYCICTLLYSEADRLNEALRASESGTKYSQTKEE